MISSGKERTMAKYTVTHACGHTVTHALFGAYRDREKKREWLKDGLCSDCYREEQTRLAQAQAEQQGLPALIGSEKQVAWAAKIRGERLDTWERLIALWEAKLEEKRESGLTEKERGEAQERGIEDPLAKASENQRQYHQRLTKARQETSAKWWIDHRSSEQPPARERD
jgi:hypothetical protein